MLGPSSQSLHANSPLRLVFTSDRVRVIIRSVEDNVPIPLMTQSLTFRLWSSENQIVGVGSRSRRTKPITKRGNVHCDWFIPLLLLPTPTIWFSQDHKRNVSDGVVSGVGRKWKRTDSSDSDFVTLMTLLTTPIFYFQYVISALTTPLTTLTPTPSLVKTSL